MRLKPDGRILKVDVVVKPGSKQPGVFEENGVTVLRVRERAVEGMANAACIRALAARYNVPPSAVTLVSGARSWHKRFVIRFPGE